MAKIKSRFVCKDCGGESSQWAGQCGDCGAWNALSEVVAVKKNSPHGLRGYSGDEESQVVSLCDVSTVQEARFSTDLVELDRVLGGGLVEGSVVLIGGDPGIGKSTLLLQTLANLSENQGVLYVTGEESLKQVSLRASRLGLKQKKVELLTQTQIEKIIWASGQVKPKFLVIDSIQTMFTEQVSSAPGSVSQVRESTGQLVRFAKQTGTTIFLVGHVTKEGTLAGPRVLEHMVDVVLYFEGQKDSRYRLIRAIKNRFGAVNELGVFAMTDKGLKAVTNPSALFISGQTVQVSGACVMVTWEGSRPLLVEVQALVDETPLPNPKRLAVGCDAHRLGLLLAVLHRHGGVCVHNMDVFLNVVGGVKITETGIDLAIIVSLISSLKNRPIPPEWVVFGEVGLGGEIRPVQSGQERIKEAKKHGFKKAIVPKGNFPKNTQVDASFEVIAVDVLSQVLELI